MKTLKIFLLTTLVLEFFQLHSQDLKQNRLPCLKKTYYIAYHPVLIGNNVGFPINHIDSGIIMVNKLLEPICIEFKVLDTFKLNNYNYNIEFSKLDITKEYFRDEMARMHNVKKMIIYIIPMPILPTKKLVFVKEMMNILFYLFPIVEIYPYLPSIYLDY